MVRKKSLNSNPWRRNFGWTSVLLTSKNSPYSQLSSIWDLSLRFLTRKDATNNSSSSMEKQVWNILKKTVVECGYMSRQSQAMGKGKFNMGTPRSLGSRSVVRKGLYPPTPLPGLRGRRKGSTKHRFGVPCDSFGSMYRRIYVLGLLSCFLRGLLRSLSRLGCARLWSTVCWGWGSFLVLRGFQRCRFGPGSAAPCFGSM